jgi:hypothetical protein
MRPGKKKIGWLLFLTGAIALICDYYAASFHASQVLVPIYAVAHYGLSALLTYDLFHKVDLSIRYRTLLTVIMWMIPCANWFVFLKYRNASRAILA